MEDSENDPVTLEIESKTLKCDRNVLINNSDYFRAMFQGTFVESDQKSIKLQEVEYEPMCTILKMLWDKEYHVSDINDIFSVLQTSCMLQFVEITQRCVEKIHAMLSFENCLKIWFFTEQLFIKDISLPAKFLALTEFETVQKTEHFLQLTLQEVCLYLGNVNLEVDEEINVFRAANRWYKHCEDKKDEILEKLMFCIDFTRISDDNMKEIISIGDNELLTNLSKLKKESDDTRNGDKTQSNMKKAIFLLKNSTHRNNSVGEPCFLAVSKCNPEVKVIYQDRFKRIRGSMPLDGLNKYEVIGLDAKNKDKFKKLLDVSLPKLQDLKGFQIVGHKAKLYIFGGEYGLGSGSWNANLYIHDFVRPKCQMKKSTPFSFRHFQVCQVDDGFYIIGGTGKFRIVSSQLFFYNYQKGEQSPIQLNLGPLRQIKCCYHDNRLFIFDFNNRIAHSYCHESRHVVCHIKISDKIRHLFQYSDKMVIYSHNSRLYMKDGENLCELEQEGVEITIRKFKMLPVAWFIKNAAPSNSVLCSNTLYTLYKYQEKVGAHTKDFVCLEGFNLNAHESSIIFNKEVDEDLGLEGGKYCFNCELQIFKAFYPELVDGDEVINGNFV